MDKEGIEKRKYLRLDVNTKIEFSLIEVDDSESFFRKNLAESKNISIKGICFAYPKTLEEGEKISLTVYLPEDSDPIRMSGEVKWCQLQTQKSDLTYDIGVEIFNIKDSDEGKFMDFVWTKVKEDQNN